MLRQIAEWLKPYRKESLLGPFFKLLEASMELSVPFVVAAIIDRGIAEGDSGRIVRFCLLLALFGFAGLLFSVTAQYFAAKAAVGVAANLRMSLFEKIQSFSYRDLDRAGTDTLLSRMVSDTRQVQTGLNLTLRLLLRSPFVVFGAVIMAFTIDVPSALWFLAAVPVLGAVVAVIMLTAIPLYRRVQDRLDGVLGAVRENLTGARVLRAFRRENAETAAFLERNEDLTGRQLTAGRVTSLLNPLTFVLINLAAVLLIRTGALRVEAGALSQGAVVALYNYMAQILVELIKLADLILQMTKGAASFRRVKEVLDAPSTDGLTDSGAGKDTLPETNSPFRVEFRDAGLRYHERGEPALKHITLSAKPGEIVGVIGGTGSGKSTLVNLIPRFYEATEGTVLVDGTDVKDLNASELRKSVGVVPQEAVLFSGTIRENLLWGNPDAEDGDLMDAVRLAQAEDVVQSKGGLDGRIEQEGRNLSGGQKQRLTIARALVRKPKILILDDSASALDYGTEARLRKDLARLPGKPTVFLVSQRVSSVRNADRILVLENGVTAGSGTHAELMASCPVYREIAESQSGEEAAV